MRLYFSFVLALLIPITSWSQADDKPVNTAPKNLLHLSVTPQYYFNKSYLKNDDNRDNSLSTKNTTGYNVGIDYQRITKIGLTFSAGLQYGHQEHFVNLNFDLSNYDPGAKELQGFTGQYSYNFKTQFLGSRFMIGYIKPLPWKSMKGWAAEFKAGWASKGFSKSMHAMGGPGIIDYYSDIDDKIYIKPFCNTNTLLGNTSIGKPFRSTYLQTLEFYIGLRKELNKTRFLKTLNVGLEFSTTYKNSFYAVDFTSFNAKKEPVSKDYYYDKNRAIGLYLGLGLWR